MGEKFSYGSPEDVFNEIRVASKGGSSDYHGITWQKIEDNHGIFWPCPDIDHPGTPRLYEGGHFGHADGKAHFQPVDHRPAVEEPDGEYPLILTTGRVVAHYLSGTQTRRIGGLLRQTPEPTARFTRRKPRSSG